MDLNEFIISRIKDAGYEIYIVGGAVRDKLLGVKNADTDFTTNARPEQLAKIFSDKKVVFSGESFGVTRVCGVEIATYRADVEYKVRFKANSCKPKYADTLEEDLGRRDLTINAMAIDPITGKLTDLHGGVEDLKKGIIRFIGEPAQRLEEDLARLLRALRFYTSHGKVFEKKTIEAIHEYSKYVMDNVEKDRIQKEFVKALHAKTPSTFFYMLHEVGLLKHLLPALDECYGHTGGHHHAEDVWTHCMAAGDYLSPKDITLRLAGYLHDMGKPRAYNEEDDTFIDHERIGSELAREYLRQNLYFSKRSTKRVVNLIACHMRICATLTPKAQRRLAKHLGDLDVNPRDFLRLKLADRVANFANDPNDISKIKNMVRKCGIRGIEPLPMAVTDLAISGGKLIQELSLKPSPVVGVLQRRLLEYVVEEGTEYNTYEHLLNKAKEFLADIS